MDIITRKRAKILGLKCFYTGNPCKYGHMDVRSLSGNCRECLRLNGRVWYGKNTEYKLNKSKEVYSKNRDVILARTGEYSKSNPQKVAVWSRNCRVKRAGVKGSHNRKDILDRLKWQRGKCAICRCDITDSYEVDHYNPISLGGNNWPSNIQLTCRTCNRQKHSKDPIEFYQSRGFLL